MNAPTLALSFTEPRALWALLLAAPLLAAHLWRRRRLRRVVPFVPLLSEALGPARGGGGWRRLAETGALAARLLALGALTLAWAGPEPAPRAPPVPLVLVLDGDLTTGCQEPDGRSRLAHALHLGAAHVRAHAQGPVSAVWAGLTPRVLAQGRRDRSALADELVGAGGATVVSPEPGTADLRPALRLARDLGGPEARVLLLSARELPPELAPGAAEAPAGALQVVGTGSASRNQGFVALHVAPVDEGPRLRVSATVRNEHDEPV